MQVLKVFTNEKGEFGNPVGIVVDTKQKIGKDERLKITINSGFSEVVFINNFENKDISIFCPQNEIIFAGHALVGSAYFLSQKLNQKITQLKSMGSTIDTWAENGLTWVRGGLDILPKWNYEQLDNADLVDKLTLSDTTNKEHTFVWAWIDGSKGLICARTFATDWGIPEDPANGSGSMRLADFLKKEITVIHGQGSVIHARPAKNNYIEVGGLVV